MANKAIHDTLLSLKKVKKGDIEKSVLGCSISYYTRKLFLFYYLSFYEETDFIIIFFSEFPRRFS